MVWPSSVEVLVQSCILLCSIELLDRVELCLGSIELDGEGRLLFFQCIDFAPKHLRRTPNMQMYAMHFLGQLRMQTKRKVQRSATKDG
uniref:Uncharacterized protein n=1 Tax=Noccaea caerulescens TaxID=107243 RepID=A0A1J3FF24_NOCCA